MGFTDNTQGKVMTAYRAVWFEAFRDFVQFYPKLAATLAFGSMAAAGRIIANNPAAVDGSAASAALPVTARKIKAHKPSKHPARKTAERTSGRRKAA
jgi:hypothetical protein